MLATRARSEYLCFHTLKVTSQIHKQKSQNSQVTHTIKFTNSQHKNSHFHNSQSNFNQFTIHTYIQIHNFTSSSDKFHRFTTRNWRIHNSQKGIYPPLYLYDTLTVHMLQTEQPLRKTLFIWEELLCTESGSRLPPKLV